jgi:3-hydroxyacyl-CoA dehydrogenase
MTRDKINLMIDLVAADVVSAIIEDTAVSVQEAMSAFYNSEVFDRLCDAETGLYRESGGYVYALYSSWVSDGHAK